MEKSGFGYDGFSDKITTHRRSHLSLLRESYHKNDLKRKITAVNLKISFTAGLCLFFFFWHLSFLLFVKSRWDATIFLHALLSSSSLSSTHIKSLSFCFSIFHSSLCSTYIFFLPLISLYAPLTSKYQKSYHTFLYSLLGPSMDLGLSASLYISFLRISTTCCVSWTNRLFGKASPINGFGVSLPATV